MNKLTRSSVSISICILTSMAGARPAPSFSAQASDGKTYTLKGLGAGKPILLMFFSAGCPSTAGGISSLNRLQAMFYGKVVVAGVVNLDVRQTKVLALKHHAKFPILSDQNAKISGAYGAQTGLDNVLVLPSGELAHLWSGYDQRTLKAAETLLAKAHGLSFHLDLSSFPKNLQTGCPIGMRM